MKLFSGDQFRFSLKYFLIGRAAQGFLSVLITILTVRVMVSTEYGMYMVLIGLIDVIRPVSSLGILPTMQQYLPEMAMKASREQFHNFLRISSYFRWVLLGGICLLLFILWRAVSNYLNLPENTERLPIYVVFMVFFVLSAEYTESTLEALLAQKYAQLARVLHTFARFVLIALMSLASLISISNIILMEAIVAIFVLTYAEHSLRRTLSDIKPDGTKVFTIKELLTFATHMSVSQLAWGFTSAGTLRLIVSKMLGVEVAGNFGFLQTLLAQVNKLMPSLLLVNLIRPTLISMRAKGEFEKVAEAIGLIFKTNVLIIWPLIPISMFYGDFLLAIISNNRLSSLGDALTLMLIGLSATTQQQVASIVMQVYKFSRQQLVIGIFYLITPILIYIGSQYTFKHVCFAYMVSMILIYIFTLISLRGTGVKVRMDYLGSLLYLIVLIIDYLIVETAAIKSMFVVIGLFLTILVLLLPIIKPIASFETKIIKDALKWDIPLIKYLTRN